jgi:NDP-sugar pyrophosphorylase family protein
MASRYGSMKQVQSFGPAGETIMEYSIYDAIQAGFKKVVFIIREEFLDVFTNAFAHKLKDKIEVEYVFQKLESFTEGKPFPADRTKPWGTAHAVLCCKGKVNEPFAVINADDFYGRDGFAKAHQFLTTTANDETYAIIGYELNKTLSENGSVSRGICVVNANNEMTDINERTKIYRNEKGIIVYEDETGVHAIDENASVSMNFWCFAPSIFNFSEQIFHEFLEKNAAHPKAEFFIPIVADAFVKTNTGKIKVVPTAAKWFGVTYKEDAPDVQASINALVSSGEYPNNLWQYN